MNPALYGNDPVNWMTATPTPQPGSGGPMDSDGDGMPDAWETDHGLDPDANDADEDPDGDGMTNVEEYRAGTDPQDPDSLLQITLNGVTGNQATLRFDAVEGKSYRVLYRNQLSSGPWLVLTQVLSAPVARQVEVTDPDAGASGQRFYRLATP
jgi:hypothetical protein